MRALLVALAKSIYQLCKMYGLSFDKMNVIIACCDDIFSRYCIQKS